jgi:GNAT superfamily N-acetyltransferase
MLAASLADGFDRSELATQITPDERAVVVGLIDDVPVGIAYAALRRIGGSRVAGLELLFVEPPARGIGVADAMLEVVLERCASWGVTAIDAPALPGDRAAKSFFEAHGFKARLLVMQRDQAPAGNGVST